MTNKNHTYPQQVMANKNHTYPLFSIKEPESIIGPLSDYQDLNLASYQDGKSNILILANGFEDRANEFINQVCKLKYKADTVLIAKYGTNIPDNKKKYNKMINSVKSVAKEVFEIDADNQQKTNQKIQNILSEIKNHDNEIKVVFDISGGSNRLILSVLHSLIQEQERKIIIDIVYYEAKSYYPTYEEWISNKEQCIKSVINSDIQENNGVEPPFFSPLYNGHFEGSYSDFLITIPTLSLNRPFAALFESNENFFTNQTPDSIYWILGQPEVHTWREELQKEVLELGLRKRHSEHLFTNTNQVSCSTLDYKDIMLKLFNLIDTNVKNRKNITLMPMGSKMQTIGIALTLFARSECKVMLVKPKSFNSERYTSRVGKGWTLELKLDDIKSALKKIGCYEKKPRGRQNSDQQLSS